MSAASATLTKSFTAGAAVTRRRIVKIGAADGAVIQGAAATDTLIGVSADIDAASGARVDVHLAGVVEVECGGTITRGAKVTSDATGKAVAAAPSAGTNNGVVGILLESAASGDIRPLLLAQHTMQG